MIPFSKRNLVLFVLIFTGVFARAQEIHFSDIQSLYGADSAGFRNFCDIHALPKKELHVNDSSYYLRCSADTGKFGFSRSFGKYPDSSDRKSFILNYFFGSNLEELKQLELEIKRSGFKLIKNQTTDLPGNYSVQDFIYAKTTETASLQIQHKAGVLAGYSLAYFRRNTKAG